MHRMHFTCDYSNSRLKQLFLFRIRNCVCISSHIYHQVAPAELEAILLTHPSVVDAGVTGIPHPNHGEVPRAYVMLKADETHTTADELKAFVAGEMPYFIYNTKHTRQQMNSRHLWQVRCHTSFTTQNTHYSR